MHSTGSIIKTYCEKVRHYLDDPDLDAKYDDNYLVRFFLASSMTDVISRVSMMSDAQIMHSMALTVAAGTQYYQLPPMVRQVLRVGVTETSTGRFLEDFIPRNEFNFWGPGWSLEGNTISFNPIPDSAKTYTILYTPSGDVGVHYENASHGVLNANGTFTLHNAGSILGTLDKRPNAYVGSYLRIFGTSSTDECIISDYDVSTRVCTLRTAASNPAGSYSYEVVPFLLEPMIDAIALSAAMRAGTGRKINNTHMQALMLSYRQAIKTAHDTLGNMNARKGKAFQGRTVDNPGSVNIVSSVTASAGSFAVPQFTYYPNGITGSLRVASMFRDAIEGRDGLDMLWIGDSNTCFNGKGWNDGFAAAMYFHGANMYATPAYQSFGGAAPAIGYKMFPVGFPTSGSPSNAVSGLASPNVSAALKATMSPGSGALAPNSNQLDFLRVETGTTIGAGEFLTVWMYEQGNVITGSKNEDAFTDVCPIGLNDQLVARVQVNIGTGGAIQPRFNNKANGLINSTLHNTVSASPDVWDIVEATMTPSNSRIESFQGSSTAGGYFKMSLGGSGGGTAPITGPISVGLWSVYRYVKGFACTPLEYRSGGTLTQISNDVVQATNNGNAVQNYLKYLRERQRQANGASGRVVVCIQGGVNNGDWAPSNPSAGITAIDNMRSAISSAWTSLGYPSSDLGFLVMISHPTDSNNSDSTLSPLRTLAQTTYSSPSGDTLNVNLNAIYPWSRINMSGFFDSTNSGPPSYDTSYAHLEENRHGYEIIASAVVAAITLAR